MTKDQGEINIIDAEAELKENCVVTASVVCNNTTVNVVSYPKHNSSITWQDGQVGTKITDEEVDLPSGCLSSIREMNQAGSAAQKAKARYEELIEKFKVDYPTVRRQDTEDGRASVYHRVEK